MQAKIPFRAKVREVGHVGSGGRGQRAGSPVSSFKFLVSRAHPLCPPKIGVTSPQGGGGMTNGKRKCENGKLKAHPLAAHLYRLLRPSGTLSEPRR